MAWHLMPRMLTHEDSGDGMCGIAGYLSLDHDPVDGEVLDRMVATIRHRGPDESGTFVEGPVALGSTRLSIIDLTTRHQPISNEDGSVWIVYNGEIFNRAS